MKTSLALVAVLGCLCVLQAVRADDDWYGKGGYGQDFGYGYGKGGFSGYGMGGYSGYGKKGYSGDGKQGDYVEDVKTIHVPYPHPVPVAGGYGGVGAGYGSGGFGGGLLGGGEFPLRKFYLLM